MPAVYKSLWSRRDDVTLANPFGAPVRGWQDVSARLDLAASNYRDGRDYEFANISTVVTPELAYTVEIERTRTRVGGIRRADSDRHPGHDRLSPVRTARGR